MSFKKWFVRYYLDLSMFMLGVASILLLLAAINLKTSGVWYLSQSGFFMLGSVLVSFIGNKVVRND